MEESSIFGRGGGPIFRYEADQFSTNLKTNGIGQTEEAVPGRIVAVRARAVCSRPAHSNTNSAAWMSNRTPTTSTSTGNRRIEPYSPALPGDPSHPLTPPFGSLVNSWAVAAPADGKVLALTEANEKVNVYAKGDTLPNVTTNAPNIPDIGHSGATVTGRIDPAGGDPITECKLEYGTEFEKYTSGSVPCAPDPSGSNFTTATDVSATLSGLTIDQPYHYRFVGSNAHGESFGGEQVVSPVAVLDVDTLDATGVDQNNATLHGVLNPDGMSTTYHFEYGLTTDYRQSTPELDPGSRLERRPGSGDGVEPAAGQALSLPARRDERTGDDLQARPDLQDREQAPGGRCAGDRTLRDRRHPDTRGSIPRTRPPPTTSSTATTPAYGTSAPATDQPVGSDDTEHQVSVPISRPAAGGHLPLQGRGDQRMGHQRKRRHDVQLLATRLPERARSPADRLEPPARLPRLRARLAGQTGSGGVLAKQRDGRLRRWIRPAVGARRRRSGLSTPATRRIPPASPSTEGSARSPASTFPNSLLDTYLATRTNSGWVTTFPGIKGSETLYTGRRDLLRIARHVPRPRRPGPARGRLAVGGRPLCLRRERRQGGPLADERQRDQRRRDLLRRPAALAGLHALRLLLARPRLRARWPHHHTRLRLRQRHREPNGDDHLETAERRKPAEGRGKPI